MTTIITPPVKNAFPIVQGMWDFTEGKKIRHCKIVATLGPSSSDESVLRELILAGLDIARLNFSHGTHEFHGKNIELIRRLSKETGRNVSILQDLQGPKIRCGKLIGGEQKLERNEELALVFGIEQSKREIIPIDYKDLIRDVKVGDQVMIDDGLLLLEIVSIKKDVVNVKVLVGGILKDRKGVNFPQSHLSLPALTEKDTRDLLFGVSAGIDLVALSFVQTPQDILSCKKIISALGSDVPVIAKIEKLSAIDAIDEITKVSDGLMVARGDLGVEGNVERVPIFQRRILAAGSKFAKPVIIATQMLESMVKNPRASLAEVTDVANGVLEGADCVMLSAEVASGKYPVESVKRMASIIHQVESWSLNTAVANHHFNPELSEDEISDPDTPWEDHIAIARAACDAADQIKARAIVCLSLTGSIARLISRLRPKTPIIAISPRSDVIQRLGIHWGVYGMRNPLFYNTDILLQDLPQLLKSLGIVKSGETIVITAGIPINSMKPTNMIKINKIP